jgi:hypothetical protein
MFKNNGCYAGEASRLEVEGHELIARGHTLLARAARLRAEHPIAIGVADDLIPLAESNLAVRTRRMLEREGRLPVVKLGRQKFTRRSDLIGLVGNGEPATASSRPVPTDPREAARAEYARITLEHERKRRL